MKKILSCLLATFGLTTACGQQNYEAADVQGFSELVADTNIVVLDVRTEAEFAEGHIQRAILIDQGQDDFVEEVKATLPLEKKIAIYCRSGRRSASAANRLADAGYKCVNLKGGFLAWKEAGKPVEYRFGWQTEYLRNEAKIDDANPAILHLGGNSGYYDLTAKTGALIMDLRDFSVSVWFKVGSGNLLDGYGHFLFAFSVLAENSAHEGPYMAMRLNEQRFETSTGGYEHEEIIMQGGKPKRDAWVHVLYRQQGHKGELYLDGKLIGQNDKMPILADIFREAPANCWIGRAPFRGDRYLTETDVADFRIYNHAVSDQEMRYLLNLLPTK